ncbi:MAG: C4-dicarboxylate ABC transporter permease [Betaproteobacteria bacterium RIFCSPLOWO2_02_FULL_65_24]|nr:MAG: C4-dicarboxylate ABC transporter permease [Betaproteobacteria bacterium RIFCSPLOWO2_02_FULL_65_24]OGA96549.1 MAG: C4-dicarboxylate ABC transporter permease [Betaproteobacteria bacterium RIFCSPLOWO2_12_FULL_66_14]
MDLTLLAVIGIVGMLALIAMHVPIGVAMALAGLAGVAYMEGLDTALSMFSTAPTNVLTNVELAAIPMFLLMGSFAAAAGLSGDLYRLFHALMGHYRGGLAMATIGGCGGFGAVCGSSIATAATFMRIALPEMRSRGYAPTLATGCIAAGGTLGILIPPSNLMLLYGVLTEQFVIALFTAAIIPGLLSILIYIVAIGIIVRVRPGAGPAGPRMPWRERLAVARECWGVVTLAVVVSGGIYGGIFTVLEAAAVGSIFAFLFAMFRRALSWQAVRRVLAETAASTGLIYVIIFGATIFTFFITLTQMPETLVRHIEAMNLAPWAVIFMLLVIYIVLGSIFETVSAMIITLPVVFPLIVGLGFDPIWWGVINIMVIEIGQTTPPIGIIPFVLHGMAPEVSLRTIFTGIIPFFVADLVRLAIVAMLPILALWLPEKMGLLIG